jgi:hypothetical protein
VTPHAFHDFALRPALTMLPPAMTSPEARAMVLAIALQESKLIARRQVHGPARGYAQFEFAGVSGVMRHEASRVYADQLCDALDVPPLIGTVHAALEYQDILAAGFARLLLWTHPHPLPKEPQAWLGWQQYLATWRPGKPHQHTWQDHWTTAWAVVHAHA